jgi:hypothetical protein
MAYRNKKNEKGKYKGFKLKLSKTMHFSFAIGLLMY